MAVTRRLRGLRAPVVCVVLGVVLTGCSVPGLGPNPDEALDRLASALASGDPDDLDDVDFVGGEAADQKARQALTTLTKPLGTPRVRASEGASEDDDTATGTLTWRWPVGSTTWTYETTVALEKGETRDGDGWLVRWTPTLVEPSLEAGETLARTTIKPERGQVLGAGDQPIVQLRPVLRLGVDKAAAGGPAQATRAATALARLTDVDARDLVKQTTAAGPRAFVQAIVYRRNEVPPAVLSGLEGIPGARAISDRLPLAPTKDFAAPVLGSVGPATAELVEESKGRIRAGDDVGLSGLQKRYDEQLSGTRGETVVAVDAEGGRRTLFTAEPSPGEPLRTTIEPAAQQAAQRVLSDLGPPSALVAIRPSTGDLVAVASGPGSGGYSTATIGRYAPGSTFKVVSALALLRAGVTPRTPVSCPATTVVDGKRFKNYDDYPAGGLGRISFEDALANSCNTAFITERTKVGAEGLASAAAALGLGVDHDTGFSSFFGSVGEADSQTQAAASMIGQGSVLASPMAMSAVVASVMKGSAVLPRLLPDHEVAQQPPSEPLTSAEAQQLRTMMRAVVERGSGSLLGDLPGGPVIAKTGTAEFGDQPPLPTHAWMVAGRGDLAVAVFVERGDSGSGTAGPVLRAFLESVR